MSDYRPIEAVNLTSHISFRNRYFVFVCENSVRSRVSGETIPLDCVIFCLDVSNELDLHKYVEDLTHFKWLTHFHSLDSFQNMDYQQIHSTHHR